MSDTKTAVGVRTKIEESGDWTTFHIDVGSQYPLKLATKVSKIIEEARAADGISDWEYTEKESEKINEHTGKPYINRYLNGVKPHQVGGSIPGETAQPSHAPLVAGDKDRAITRMSVLRTAAETLGPGADPAAVIELAGRYETWVYRDITDIPF